MGKKLIRMMVLASLFSIVAGCGQLEEELEEEMKEGPGEAPPGCIDAMHSSQLGNKLKDDTTFNEDCYYFKGDFKIGNGTHLQIESGTELKFAENALFTLSGGTMTAEGTKDEPIVFSGTTQEPGWWRGIQVEGTASSKNLLKHVKIRDAGGEPPGSVKRPANIMFDNQGGNIEFKLQNTEISNSAGYGLYAEKNVVFDSFKNNKLKNNQKAAASINAWVIDDFDSSTSFSGNSDSWVHVSSANIRFDEKRTWPALDVPYRIEGDLQVKKSELTVDPGTQFEFMEGASLTLVNGGPYKFAGTEEAPIVLTGAQKQKGYWRGVQIEGTTSSENTFENAAVKYAGGTNNTFGSVRQPANIALDNQSGSVEFAFNNVEVSNSGGYGIYAEKNTEISSFKNNTVTKNARAAAWIEISVIDNLASSSSFTGNQEDFVDVAKGTLKSDSPVVWPSIDVPYRALESLKVKKAELTVEPNTFVFEEDKGLTFVQGGPYVIEGTDDDPVVFTGTNKSAGSWSGIQIEGTTSADNIFRHAVIEYGGSDQLFGSVSPGNVMLDNQSGSLEFGFEDTAIRNSGGLGLYVENNVTVSSCSNISFKNNADGDIGGDKRDSVESQCGQ